jgi:hypothetical protein
MGRTCPETERGKEREMKRGMTVCQETDFDWNARPSRVRTMRKPLSLPWKAGVEEEVLLPSPAPPRRHRCGLGVGQVSWLKAAGLAFPDRKGSSGWMESAFRDDLGPFTVAGPRRIRTGFRNAPPPRRFVQIIFVAAVFRVNGEPQGLAGLSRKWGESTPKSVDFRKSDRISLTNRIASRSFEEKYTEPSRFWLECLAACRGFFLGYRPCRVPNQTWGNGPFSPPDA